MTESPLFNFDTNQVGVTDPHEDPEIIAETKCLFAFVETADLVTFLQPYHPVEVGTFSCITREFPILRIEVEGQLLTVMQAPLGAPAATQILDYLIGHGVKQIISMGSCGVLTDHAEGAFLLPMNALRDEGTSYHYLPAETTVTLNPVMQQAIETTISQHHETITRVNTWTTDGYFRETEKLVDQYRAAGYQTVEMECAALAACAQFRGVDFGQFFFTADSLAHTDAYDKRDWGRSARQTALRLGLATLLALPNPLN